MSLTVAPDLTLRELTPMKASFSRKDSFPSAQAPSSSTQVGSPSTSQESVPPSSKPWFTHDTYTLPAGNTTPMKSFVANLLNISPEKVADTLYQSLTPEKQDAKAKETIDKAVQSSTKNSGATIMMINTKLDGVLTIVAQGARRGWQHHTNGSCEPNESLHDAAKREFAEELGNPRPDGILMRTLNDNNHCISLIGSNQIGANAKEISKRILQNRQPYLNGSALFLSDKVDKNAAEAEVQDLHSKLTIASTHYQPAVDLVYDKTADFTDPSVQKQANAIIVAFKHDSHAVITENLMNHFEHEGDLTDPEKIKASLRAIIDLSENKGVALIDETELAHRMELFTKNIKTFKEDGNFAPGFDNFIAHQENVCRSANVEVSTENFLKTLKHIVIA